MTGWERMNDRVKELTQEIQDRIRDLAYLMWEAAGRQQGMAMEYWLEAEREVLRTMQAAADTLMAQPEAPADGRAPREEAGKADAPPARPARAARDSGPADAGASGTPRQRTGRKPDAS